MGNQIYFKIKYIKHDSVFPFIKFSNTVLQQFTYNYTLPIIKLLDTVLN